MWEAHSSSLLLLASSPSLSPGRAHSLKTVPVYSLQQHIQLYQSSTFKRDSKKAREMSFLERDIPKVRLQNFNHEGRPFRLVSVCTATARSAHQLISPILFTLASVYVRLLISSNG